MAQMIIYDDDEMHVFEDANLELSSNVDVCECRTANGNMHRRIIPDSTYTAQMHIGEVKAELDPTTMKRIAKYNLDKDFEELNRRIKSAEGRLKLLNAELETKENKLDFMHKICQ